MAILTKDEVFARLVRECRIHGAGAVARRYRVSQSCVINIQKGRASIGEKVLAGMGLEVVYREVER